MSRADLKALSSQLENLVDMLEVEAKVTIKDSRRATATA
jgi:hypothetical protein